MSRLTKLIQELCPNGVEEKRLGDIATVSRGGNFQKKDYVEEGVPCIHYGQIYTQYGLFVDKTISFISEEKASRQKFAFKNDIVMAVTSENIDDVCKCIAWLSDEAVAISGHTAIIRHTINPKYLVYYLHSTMFYKQKRKLAHGTKVIEVTPDKLLDIMIPVPPSEVQSEIVRVLDNFTELVTELTSELAAEHVARKKQYDFYRECVINEATGASGKLLDLLSRPITDGPHTTPNLVSEGVPFISAAAIWDGSIHFEKAQGFITKEFDAECAKKYKPQRNDIFMVKSGSTTGKVAFVDTDEDFNIWSPLAAMRADNEITARYIYHFLQTQSAQNMVMKKMSHGSQPNLSMRALEQFDVKIPSIEEQARIVKILDRLDSLYNGILTSLSIEIEARQKQYEYYRDKLLTFKKK